MTEPATSRPASPGGGTSGGGTARAALATLRPRQWVKNLFVAAPLVFSKNLGDPERAAREALAVAAFCALSGAVYAFNDVLDAEADRKHPTKRHRPVAAGRLSSRAALALSAVLAAAALAGCAALSWMLMAVAGGYLVNNLAYSLGLKRIAFLDVAMLAGGFLLRVWAGALAIAVPPSPWLLTCTGLLAGLLGFGKRAHELWLHQDAERDPAHARASLSGYRLRELRWAMIALAAATSVAYALYTQDARTVSFFGTRALVATVPFCVLGIARFLQLSLWRPGDDSPTDAILRDWPFLVNLAAWGATVIAIIYGAH